MDQTARLKLDIIKEGTVNPYASLARNTCIMDAMNNPVIESRTVIDPPSNAEIGKVWLVPVGATGLWAGHDGDTAIKMEAGWTFVPPFDGFHGKVADEGRKEIVSDGNTTTEQAAGGGGTGHFEYDTFSFDTHRLAPTLNDGASKGELPLTGTRVQLEYYQFPENVDTYVYAQFTWPKQADLSDLKISLSVTSDKSDTGSLRWEFLFFWWDHGVQTLRSSGGNISIDFTTEGQRIRNDRLYSLISGKFSIPQDLSINNSLSGVQIGRIGSNNGDDFDREIRLNSVTIQYKVMNPPRGSW